MTNSIRLRFPNIAFALTLVVLGASCTPATPTSTLGPLFEVLEGTRPAATFPNRPRSPLASPTVPTDTIEALSTAGATSDTSSSPTPTPTIVQGAQTDVSPTAGASATETIPPGVTQTVSAKATPSLTPSSDQTTTSTASATAIATATDSGSSSTASTTPTPTMASSAIPTPVVSIGWGLSHFNLIKDTTNNALHLLGVLKNETGKDQDLFGVIIGFLDDSGDTIGFDFDVAVLEIAPQGVSVPFHLELDLIDYVSFELDIDTDLSQDVIVTLSTMDVQVASNNGGYDVTGSVTNPGVSLFSYSDVTVALLDTSGKTIGVGLTQLSALGNGETVDFTIQIEETEIFGTYASFLIVAVGL